MNRGEGEGEKLEVNICSRTLVKCFFFIYYQAVYRVVNIVMILVGHSTVTMVVVGTTVTSIVVGSTPG